MHICSHTHKKLKIIYAPSTFSKWRPAGVSMLVLKRLFLECFHQNKAPPHTHLHHRSHQGIPSCPTPWPFMSLAPGFEPGHLPSKSFNGQNRHGPRDSEEHQSNQKAIGVSKAFPVLPGPVCPVNSLLSLHFHGVLQGVCAEGTERVQGSVTIPQAFSPICVTLSSVIG